MENQADILFWGEFEHGVDDKGRVIMPQDFRGPLGETFIVTRGPDKAVFVFPLSVWQDIERRLRSQVLQRQGSFLQRMFGGTTPVKLDPQFRLAIPKHLRDWAEITPSQTAVLVGEGPKIEIWSKGNWDAYNSEHFTYDKMFDAAEAVGIAEVLQR